MPYNHKSIESKWQKRWEAKKLYHAIDNDKRPKFYGLIEFPYPSGDGLHVGHPRPYIAMDIIAQKRRMQGYNVLFPIGFDAFGLPAENYAIKTGIHPKIVTKKNIKRFTEQIKSLGISFDWDRCFATTDPNYYKWTQWIFLKMYEKGLAYKDKIPINWCLSCKIGLANEEVANGKCERCGGEVEKREKEQWMLQITKYADRLIDDLEEVDYLEKIKLQQVNWIGRSEGARVKFEVRATNSELRTLNYELEVFTTRPDTLFGATYMVLAPEHGLVKKLKEQIINWPEAEGYIQETKKKSDLVRADLGKEKTGVELKGIKAVNPVNNEEIPVFIADYVLMGYGTGAIMAVPAHDGRDFEFAKKFNLPIIEVIQGGDIRKEAYVGDGKLINSDFLNGLSVPEAIKKITEWLEEKDLGKKEVNYKLRDWIFSRQRYWGEPIPLIYCEQCRELVEDYKSQIPNPKSQINSKFEIRNSKQAQINKFKIQNIEYSLGELINPGWVVDNNLPLELPEVKKYQPTDSGESPLAAIKDWVNTKCPKCGGPARRETDTMPNWAGSNWYFLRYCDPRNKKKLASMDKLKYWMAPPARRSSEEPRSGGGVDWYNGGMEHTTLHLLYSRFVYKFLWDIGAVPEGCGPEPYKKRTSHGMVLAEDGEKMSKSRGNVINPDEIVEKYGADTLRLYEMFMGPFGEAIAWSSSTMIGVRRFLEKVWELFVETRHGASVPDHGASVETQNFVSLQRLLHKTIKKVSEDIEEMKFNTAVAQMMIFVNEMGRRDAPWRVCTSEIKETFLKILAPFAPHLAEELWEKLGHQESIFKEKWPEYDKNLIKDEIIELVIQVNGRVRDKFEAEAEISEEEAKEKALASTKIQKWIEGKEIKKVVYVKGRLVSIVV